MIFAYPKIRYFYINFPRNCLSEVAKSRMFDQVKCTTLISLIRSSGSRVKFKSASENDLPDLQDIDKR